MRMFLKNNTRISFFTFIKIKIIIIVVIITFFSVILFKNLNYYYLTYSENEARALIVNAVNDIVNERIINEISDEQLYTVIKNKSGEIEMIDYNSYLINKLLNDTNRHINNYIFHIDNGKENTFYVPLGSILQNPLFNGRGPRIPVKMELIGSASSKVNSRVQNYGINNSVIEIFIHVEVTEKIILPITSKNIVVSSDIPISYKIIRGKIPSYYIGSNMPTDSIYMLPIE